MANVVLATFGSLGDLHPKLALALELKQRGHTATIAAMEFYREKVEMLGLKFWPMAPHLDPQNRDLARELMDAKTGTEKVIREVVFGNLKASYDDILAVGDTADMLITGEIVYAAKSVVEKTGIKWVSSSLAPISFFSAHDPPVPPTAQWVQHLRPLGAGFHRPVIKMMQRSLVDWYTPYKDFRRSIGLSEDHDPIFRQKFSNRLHLAMFSRVLGRPQMDWPSATLQTGFCFYDGKDDLGHMPAELNEFLDNGEPPIVFTLGSAAVMDTRVFFEVSAAAAQKLGRRAVLLYGKFNAPPVLQTGEIVGFDYAPFSLLFSRAACVVHQAGAGTTGHALLAGVPQLIMPYSHDQPDNAIRCKRAGLAEVINRSDYNVRNVVPALNKILKNKDYAVKAAAAQRIVAGERGTQTACDAIEDILKK